MLVEVGSYQATSQFYLLLMNFLGGMCECMMSV
jgi:hypothetical protein